MCICVLTTLQCWAKKDLIHGMQELTKFNFLRIEHIEYSAVEARNAAALDIWTCWRSTSLNNKMNDGRIPSSRFVWHETPYLIFSV